MGILFIEILLTLTFLAVYVHFNRHRKTFTQLITECCLLALFFGTPIIFTSITRSVFEVSKMYLLRLSQLIIMFVLFINYVRSANLENYKIKNPHLVKILIGWVAVNLLSFFFSPNRYIAFIGAYDRWDGIITMLNYVVLFYLIIILTKDRIFMFWLMGALLFTGVLSSIYGIYQSFGVDFMNWSVDPTARVFACINNPVHFSAYIAMLIPVTIGLLHFSLKHFNVNLKNLKEIPRNQSILFGTLLISIFVLYYTSSFLSFGRATWVGLSFALMFFYFFILELYHPTKTIQSFVNFSLGMLVAVAFFVFKVHEAKLFLALALGAMAIVFVLIEFNLFKNNKNLIQKIALLALAAQMQFVTISFVTFGLSLLCIGVIYYFSEIRYKKIHVLILTGLLLLLFIPSFQTNYIQFEIGKRLSIKTKTWKDTKTDPITARDIIELRNNVIGEMVQEGKLTKTEGNVLYRTASYSSDFKTGSARTAMWQSAIGLSVKNLKDPNFKAWVKEYPLLGTGPGTIKAFFPKFRRPDYGRLEGGHNFTPDKLHNDYLDTIATHGLIGFAVYFIFFIPLCGYLVIKHISEHPGHPANLLIVGLSAGVIVYLGQTMFNFGVVATKVLYYELLALAVALVLNHQNLFDQNG